MPESAEARCECTRAWKSAPSVATPVAIPTCLKVLLIPEAMPLRSRGATLIAVEASGGFVSPIPIPPTTKPARSAVQSSPGESPSSSSSEAPTRPRPPPSRSRTGTLAESRPAIGATRNEQPEIGSSRIPAWSAE